MIWKFEKLEQERLDLIEVSHRESQEVGTFLHRQPAHDLIANHCTYDAAQRNG